MASQNIALNKFDNGDRVSCTELNELITQFKLAKESLEKISDSAYKLVYLDICDKLNTMMRYKNSRSSKVHSVTVVVSF